MEPPALYVVIINDGDLSPPGDLVQRPSRGWCCACVDTGGIMDCVNVGVMGHRKPGIKAQN